MENKKNTRQTKTNSVKKTTSNKAKKTTEINDVENIKDVDENVVVLNQLSTEEDVESTNEVIQEKRKFEKDELIPCLNLFVGTTVMVGKRTKNKYIWQGFGDIQDVEYDDLKAAVLNKRSDFIYAPYILVQDDDFVNEFPYLMNFYTNMRTPEELEDLVKNGSQDELKTALMTLPKGLVDSIKGIVSTMIQEGTLDSVKKIRIIDEALGTELLKQVEMFS